MAELHVAHAADIKFPVAAARIVVTNARFVGQDHLARLRVVALGQATRTEGDDCERGGEDAGCKTKSENLAPGEAGRAAAKGALNVFEGEEGGEHGKDEDEGDPGVAGEAEGKLGSEDDGGPVPEVEGVGDDSDEDDERRLRALAAKEGPASPA